MDAKRTRRRAYYLAHKEQEKAAARADHAERAKDPAWTQARNRANRERWRRLQARRLAAWLYAHPRCVVCWEPVKTLGSLTCGKNYCSKTRWAWFGKRLSKAA